MKKFLSWLCIVLCIVSFVSCGNVYPNNDRLPNETTGETHTETLSEETEPPLSQETFPPLSPETTPVTSTETEKETVPETTEEVTSPEPKFAEPIDLASVLNENNTFLNITVGRFHFLEYYMEYSDYENKTERAHRLLLPDGVTDGKVFSTEKNEDENSFFVYVYADRDGKECWFKYGFVLEDSNSYPVSREELTQAEANILIEKKNNYSDKIYSGDDAMHHRESYGEYELFLPIAQTGYIADHPRIIYCPDNANLERMALICASGYAHAYPLEESAHYEVNDGYKYETFRYKWGRIKADYEISESYYTPLDNYNKRDFIYLIKIKDNFYAYVSIKYKDHFAPPENCNDEIKAILNGMEVTIR